MNAVATRLEPARARALAAVGASKKQRCGRSQGCERDNALAVSAVGARERETVLDPALWVRGIYLSFPPCVTRAMLLPKLVGMMRTNLLNLEKPLSLSLHAGIMNEGRKEIQYWTRSLARLLFNFHYLHWIVKQGCGPGGTDTKRIKKSKVIKKQ